MNPLEIHIKRNVISGRDLGRLEYTLRFDRNQLRGHRILNFGSGGSNLGKDLKESGVECEVIDVDVLPNPHTVHDESFTQEEYMLRRATMERKVKEDADGQLLLKPVEDFENSRLGIEGRNFIQLDKHARLPFPDGHFDEIFVSWSFHQLPEFEMESQDPREVKKGSEIKPLMTKEEYLKEFMRVGKKIFIAPIGRRELREIEESLMNSQFVIKKLLHYGGEENEIDDDTRRKNREKGLTDDGYVIHDLDIDYSQRPHSVGSSGCASVIIERR